MKRFQLFEFEDLSWFPSLLRNYMTDFLRTVVEKFDLFGCAAPILTRALRQVDEPRIVDLASGGGGSWGTLVPKLKEEFPELRVTLTDLYPNPAAWEHLTSQLPDVIQPHNASVDARNVPVELRGVRTQFLSLHHFSPADAEAILANAVRNNAPVVIFEGQQRDIAHVIQFALSPIMVLLITPMIRPFDWRRLVFTYLIPILPLLVGWDGVVSVLRTYSTDEMLAMAHSADSESKFHWESEILRAGQGKVLYLAGWPKGKGEAETS